MIGAVCIEGPKECGKIWTASHHCHSEIHLGDSTAPFYKRKFAELILNRVLEEETLRRTVKVIGAK